MNDATKYYRVAPKDPLRTDPLPPNVRIKLVEAMDDWQLVHLSLSIILPLRPEEAAGLLISDVDFNEGWLKIGTRLGGSDFTKARQSFKLPFPKEVRPILKRCIGGRAEGPLLRNRKAYLKNAGQGPASYDELSRIFEQMAVNDPSDSINTEQDRKMLFRRMLRALGGISTDAMANEFARLLKRVGMQNGPTLYALRHSTTKGLKDAKLSHLDMLYLTSHSSSGILIE